MYRIYSHIIYTYNILACMCIYIYIYIQVLYEIHALCNCGLYTSDTLKALYLLNQHPISQVMMQHLPYCPPQVMIITEFLCNGDLRLYLKSVEMEWVIVQCSTRVLQSCCNSSCLCCNNSHPRTHAPIQVVLLYTIVCCHATAVSLPGN